MPQPHAGLYDVDVEPQVEREGVERSLTIPRDVIVVGASWGGVEALQILARALPADFGGVVLVVLHVSPNGPSVLPRILSRAGRLPAVHPSDGETIQRGRIYIAPPDRHLLVRPGKLELSSGPRENRTRPSIDALFRSAAASYGPRVAGVVLTGTQDDGTAGLRRIKEHGGIAIVQDPAHRVLPDSQTAGPEMFSADPLDLGAEFLRWEHATVALCEAIGVNPFDQPDVEEAKKLARAELTGGGSQHAAPLPTLMPGQLSKRSRPGDYVAVLAYLPPTPAIVAQLQELRADWGRKLGCAATLGIGPRYLHSTGQLHKGGPNTGLFLVITTDSGEDLEIPSMGWTFGELHHAQARGDIRALLARGRRVAHVHLSSTAELSQLKVAAFLLEE